MFFEIFLLITLFSPYTSITIFQIITKRINLAQSLSMPKIQKIFHECGMNVEETTIFQTQHHKGQMLFEPCAYTDCFCLIKTGISHGST